MKRGRFTIIRGSSRPPLTIYIADDSYAAIDFTTATEARLVVSSLPETAEASLVLNKTLTIVDPATGGRLLATWTSAEIAAIPAGTYVGQIEVDFADGQTGIWGEIDFVVVAPRKQQA